MKRTIIIILTVVACLLVGFIAKHFQHEALIDWYPALNKSSLTPSIHFFSIIQNIIYVFMGLSIGFIINRGNPREMLFVRLFSIQLLLNFLCSISFFYLKNPLLGFINIILLVAVIVIYLIKTYKRANKFSFTMFIPYLLWSLFLGYLNLYILLNN